MESAGRRQGERAGSAESTRGAQARPRGRRCRQAAQRAHEPGSGTWVVDVENGWMGNLLTTTLCIRNVFDRSKSNSFHRFKLAVQHMRLHCG